MGLLLAQQTASMIVPFSFLITICSVVAVRPVRVVLMVGTTSVVLCLKRRVTTCPGNTRKSVLRVLKSLSSWKVRPFKLRGDCGAELTVNFTKSASAFLKLTSVMSILVFSKTDAEGVASDSVMGWATPSAMSQKKRSRVDTI